MQVLEKSKQTATDESKVLKICEKVLPFFLFFLCFGVCCLIKYSDGDDAFFLENVVKRPGFLDFTAHLTKTMNGRIGATATLWLIFSNSIWLWRVLNAFMMTAYVLCVTKIAGLINKSVKGLNPKLIACASYALMSVGILGYSCMWITGSVNYLWPTTLGLFTLYPFIKSVFDEEGYSRKELIPALFTGAYVCLAQEQIAATVVASCVIVIGYRAIFRKKLDYLQAIALIIFVTSFIILFLSPANSSRVGREIARWLPEYADFTFTDKLFTMLQWVASSFANSLCWLMALIWGGLCIGFFRAKKKVSFAVSAVFTVIIFACCAGIGVLSDLGLNHLDITKIIEDAPRFSDLSALQTVMVVFWLLTVAVTPVLIFISIDEIKSRYATVITFLAAVACMAVMMFSPTIYASGERTLFVSATLLTVIVAVLLGKKTDIRGTALLIAALGITAVLQLLQNMDYLLSML